MIQTNTVLQPSVKTNNRVHIPSESDLKELLKSITRDATAKNIFSNQFTNGIGSQGQVLNNLTLRHVSKDRYKPQIFHLFNKK